MHEPDAEPITPDDAEAAPVPYVRPGVERRSSSHDPLVWTVASPVVC